MKFWRAAAFSALALSAVIAVDSLRRIGKLRRKIEEIQENFDMAKMDAYEDGVKYATENHDCNEVVKKEWEHARQHAHDWDESKGE